jgi:TolA-binding protein
MYKFLSILVISAALFSGCSNSDKKAAELLDTASFEEKQNNFDHAAKLYDEILKKHPASKAAKDAAAHLQTLKSRTH